MAPSVDMNGSSEQLDLLLRGLQAALASRHASGTGADQPTPLPPARAVPRAEPSTIR